MGHNASLIQMGATKSNIKDVTNMPGTIAAGLIVRQKSDGTISVAKADGSPLGISLGRSLSDNGRTAIARRGVLVPVLLTASFTPTLGAQVAISDTTGKAKAYTGTGDSYVNAVYASGKIDAYDEDGAAITDGVALIDFVGGL